jgi:hypothetical protein
MTLGGLNMVLVTRILKSHSTLGKDEFVTRDGTKKGT